MGLWPIVHHNSLYLQICFKDRSFRSELYLHSRTNIVNGYNQFVNTSISYISKNPVSCIPNFN